MPFRSARAPEQDTIRQFAENWGSIVGRRAFGEDGPDLELDFDSMEQAAVTAAQALTKGTIEYLLQQQRRKLGDSQPCPGCERACSVQTEARDIVVRGATIRYDEPKCHCPACRRDFFPSAAPSEIGRP